MGPLIKWLKQFTIIKEKMMVAVNKIKNTIIATSIASMYYNMYLTATVYFGCGVINLLP